MKAGDCRCHICGCDATESPLYRQNKKGEEPIWSCSAHNIPPIDPEVEEITSIIHSHGKSRH